MQTESEPMFVVTVTFLLDPKYLDRFNVAMEEQARCSLESETDCHQFDIAVDADEPARVFLYERYTDKAAFQAHLATPHFKSFNDTVAPWVEDKVVQTFNRTWPKGA